MVFSGLAGGRVTGRIQDSGGSFGRQRMLSPIWPVGYDHWLQLNLTLKTAGKQAVAAGFMVANGWHQIQTAII